MGLGAAAATATSPAGNIRRTGYRLGLVPYLNVEPLVRGLRDGTGHLTGSGLPEVQMASAVPSRLAIELRSGAYDCAIVPVFEALRHPGYRIVPGVAIGSFGPVLSVALFSGSPLDAVHTIWLDPSSLTSVNLMRVLMAERGQPVVYRQGSAPDEMGVGEAQLVIGDPALRLALEGKYAHVHDLGDLWHRHTGLPFVYAAWLAPPGAEVGPGLVRMLGGAREWGERHLRQIASEAAEGFLIPEEQAYRYLSAHLRYGLGPLEAEGMRRFADLCVSHGLIAVAPTLDFLEPGLGSGE